MKQRIRTIKPEVHTDEVLWDAEQETGLPLFRAFVGMWSFADRDGRFEWRPRVLKAGILPYWEGDFSRVLDALSTRGFLVRYRVGAREYGLVRTFKSHQAINARESPSVLPAPDENSVVEGTCTRGSRVIHASTTRATLARGEQNRTEQNRTEGNGTEQIGNFASASAPMPTCVREFVSPSWTAESQAVAFREAWLARYAVEPSMGGKNVGDFHARVLSTASARQVDPESLFRDTLQQWLQKGRSGLEARSPYACFSSAFGELLTPSAAQESALSTRERLAAAQARLREANAEGASGVDRATAARRECEELDALLEREKRGPRR